MLKRTLVHYWNTLFQFPWKLNFVKITCCHGKFVPIKQPFPKKWLQDLQFLTSSSEMTSKGTVEPRCACSGPNSEHTFAGSVVCLRAPSSLSPCQSRLWQPRQAQACGRKRRFGKNSFCRKTDQEFGLQDTAQIQSASKDISVFIKCSQGQQVLQALFHIT